MRSFSLPWGGSSASVIWDFPQWRTQSLSEISRSDGHNQSRDTVQYFWEFLQPVGLFLLPLFCFVLPSSSSLSPAFSLFLAVTISCVCFFSFSFLAKFRHRSPFYSIHGILQARILEWVAFPPPGDLPDSGIEPESPVSPALQVDSLLVVDLPGSTCSSRLQWSKIQCLSQDTKQVVQTARTQKAGIHWWLSV